MRGNYSDEPYRTAACCCRTCYQTAAEQGRYSDSFWLCSGESCEFVSEQNYVKSFAVEYSGDSCYGYYLDDTSCESEEKDAINIIKEFAGDHELFDYEEVESAIENKSLDVLKGQLLFDFEEAV